MCGSPEVGPALPGLWMSCPVPALLSPEQNVQCEVYL